MELTFYEGHTYYTTIKRNDVLLILMKLAERSLCCSQCISPGIQAELLFGMHLRNAQPQVLPKSTLAW